MAFEKLKHLSESEQKKLVDNVKQNIPLYHKKDFSSYSQDEDWNLEVPGNVRVDPDMLKRLDAVKPVYDNLKIIGKAFENMTPFLANDDGIWMRLSHVECIEYCYNRWDFIKNTEPSHFKKKFCANTLLNKRDETAISRLWYTHYLIEKIVRENPQYNFKLDDVLKDISPPETRTQLFDRTGTAKFSSLTAGIFYARQQHEKSKQAKLEQNQNREFMKNISALGTGLPFDLMDKQEIDNLCDRALTDALIRWP